MAFSKSETTVDKFSLDEFPAFSAHDLEMAFSLKKNIGNQRNQVIHLPVLSVITNAVKNFMILFTAAFIHQNYLKTISKYKLPIWIEKNLVCATGH